MSSGGIIVTSPVIGKLLRNQPGEKKTSNHHRKKICRESFISLPTQSHSRIIRWWRGKHSVLTEKTFCIQDQTIVSIQSSRLYPEQEIIVLNGHIFLPSWGGGRNLGGGQRNTCRCLINNLGLGSVCTGPHCLSSNNGCYGDAVHSRFQEPVAGRRIECFPN